MKGKTNSWVIQPEYTFLQNDDWTNIALMRFEDDGASIITTKPSASWGNSGCATANKYTQFGGYLSIQCVVRSLSTVGMIGFSYTDPDTNFSTIKWAAYQNGTAFEVYEMGAQKYAGKAGDLAIDSIITIRADADGIVTYLINDVVKYTSAVKITEAVLVDTAFHAPNSGFNSCIVHGFIG